MADMRKETIVKLESTIDHLSGEEIGSALQILNGMREVLDASYFGGLGKKNRPCGKLEVLCEKGNEDKVIRAIFRHTHTLGLRIMEVERLVLERSEGELELEEGLVKSKNYLLEGARYQRPEADELMRLAQAKGLGMPALRFIKSRD